MKAITTLLISTRDKDDPRVDVRTSMRVDSALRMMGSGGIYPALEFMQLVGVPRSVAWRVLCSPAQRRKLDGRELPGFKVAAPERKEECHVLP